MRPIDQALIVIDVQNDFCPGGALAVAQGDVIIPQINALMTQFQTVVLTQDWHPSDHSSFAANHTGAVAFSTAQMPYGAQTLWPRHCVQGTKGAELHPTLHSDLAQLIVRKGFRAGIDSYSALLENDKTTSTGLDGYLRARGIRGVTLVGLATDFCVAFSALDAVAHGFAVTVLQDACRAIDLDGSLAHQQRAMAAIGVVLA